MRSLFLIVLVFFLSVQLLADEFKVISFTNDPKDLTARLAKNKRYDDNDEICALIKVRTDLKNLFFSASTPIVGDVNFTDGEYWVFVSGGTQQLSIWAEGFIKLSYIFPLPVKKENVYLLTLSSKSGGYVQTEKGTLIVTSSPTNMEVRIDGFPDLIKRTPCSFENYRVDDYKFNFRKDRYHSKDSIISIDKNEQKQINISLMPVWGDLIVLTNKQDVSFQINQNTYSGPGLNLSGVKNGLMPGNYELLLSKENYYPKTLSVEVREGDTGIYTVNLLPITCSLKITTVPADADVYIDHEFYGKSPVYLEEIIIGQHEIQVSKDNYIDEDRSVYLQKDNNEIINIDLKNHTKIKILSDPANADVYANGEYKGKTPLRFDVITGDIKIVLKRDYYMPEEDTLYITREGVYNYTLKKQLYLLNIKTKPSGASVKVNKVNKGRTPVDLHLEYGTYTVQIENDKYVTKTKHVNLINDREFNIRLARRFTGYLGLSYMPSLSDYDYYKYGLEMGWTYKKATRFVSGFGYNHGGGMDLTSQKPDKLKVIDVASYTDLNTGYLPMDGFFEQKTNNYFLHFGYVATKPLVFIFGINIGLNTKEGYNVYISDGNYQSPNYGDLYSGDVFIDSETKLNSSNLIYGLNMILPISNMYVSGCYWISNNFDKYSPKYMLGLGYSFK